MKKFFIAVQFLTKFPVRLKTVPSEKDVAESMVFYPLVGAGIGGFLVLIAMLLHGHFNSVINSIIILSFYAVLTGAIHIDGFADTVDGFFSSNNREKILSVMRDSRIGVMSAVGLVCLLMLKVALISFMIERYEWLFVMPVLGRLSLVINSAFGRYAREEGLGKAVDSVGIMHMLVASAIAFLLCLTVFSPIVAVCTFVFAFLVSYCFYVYVKIKINGVTGDTLGASCEITEILVLILGGIICAG